MSQPMLLQSMWGKRPAQIQQELLKKEWLNRRYLKQHLLGLREFPLIISLKAPKNDEQVGTDLEYLRLFVDEWRNHLYADCVIWKTKKRPCLTQQLPTHLQIENFEQLLQFLGRNIQQQYQKWTKKTQPLLEIHPDLKKVLVQNFTIFENHTDDDISKIKILIQYLYANMAENQYIRELVIEGIDTKFIEKNQAILVDLLDAIHQGEIREQGGLLKWLNCRDLPKGWLLVRYLDPNHVGLDSLKIAANTLQDLAIEAKNILIIENEQSCYALPKLKDCVAIAGSGKNLAWLAADWLKTKNVAYWGDIDSWGLSFLSAAREKVPQLTALMMNHETVELHQSAMVDEASSTKIVPMYLTDVEQDLFYQLQNQEYAANRLEQERLATDYIQKHIRSWLETV